MVRRLAAILAADVVGYSRLVREDEASTLAALKACRQELIEPKLAQYHGRMVKLMGDGLLAEFPSAVEAVQCAIEIQHAMRERAAATPEDRRIIYRVGINIGDVVIEDNDIYGDGVNVAARLEGLAEPSGICVARNVYNQVKDKLDLTFEHLGEREVKNIAEPVTVYRVALDNKADRLATPVVAQAAKFGRKRGIIAALVGGLLIAVSAVFIWWARAPDFEPASVEEMALPLPNEPSIAVLPFANLGNDPEQEYFADGITNDLITDLSKFKNLFVIAANSTFAYKDKPTKVQKVAEDLGVRYVLEGSVQHSGDTIRINVQLVDAVTGHHLWADRYDRQATDLFSIQNEIIKIVIGTLPLQVNKAEEDRAFKKPTDDLEAYDYYQRGFSYFLAWGKENHAKARGSLEKAIELDPEYARAYVELALVEVSAWRYGWAENPAESLARSLEYARKSVALDPNDYYTVWVLGQVYLAQGETELALSNYERALALNPHDPDLLMEMIELLVSIGDADKAVAQAETAMRLNPLYPDWYLWNLGWAQYMAGQHEEAVATLQMMTDPPNGVRRTLAAALVEVGRIDEARAMIKEYMKNEPEQTVADIRKLKYKYRPYVDKWANDLLKAGLPE